jgi:serine/threonine protein kinase
MRTFHKARFREEHCDRRPPLINWCARATKDSAKYCASTWSTVHASPPSPARAPRSRPSLETLPPGTRFGRYELIRRLAIGGMAELYLARSSGIEGFEKIVVLKRILPQHAENDDFVRMFLDEARLTATIHHANVASVYDIGRCDDGLFFTMEYVHGEDVRTIAQALGRRGRGLPLEHSLAIAIGAASGLHAAHTRTGADGRPLGIVHRDVSPSNLLVSYDGGVKIIDFGIAKASARSTETRAGTLKGKIAYMSPEQCLGEKLDRRSDVFSLGVVFYELTTGARLFPVDNEYAAMRQIVDQDAPPPSTRRPGYPPELEAIVMRALRRDRSQRYGSAEELQLALEGFVRARGIPASTVQLGYFMRDLFPERAVEQVGGLTPPPTPSRVVLPLRAPTEHGLGPMISPAPIATPAHGTPDDELAVEPIGTWMFRGDATPPESELEPSISIETPIPPTHVHSRWRLALVAGIAASISAVIAAILMMTLAQSSNHVAPDPVSVPAPAPAAVPAAAPVPAPAAAPVPAPVPALEPDPLPIIADPPPAPAKPKPKKRPVRTSRPKTKSWNPDSALPPM